MRKLIFSSIIWSLLFTNMIFAYSTKEIIDNKYLEINKSYNYDSFAYIVSNSDANVLYKSLINGTEIKNNTDTNSLNNIFASLNGNSVKILYFDGNTIYIDIYKDNNYKTLTYINTSNESTTKVTETETKEIKTKEVETNEIVESEETTKNEIIATTSIVREKIDYVGKVFKREKELMTLSSFAKDLNEENYNKIYTDIADGNYEMIFSVFLDNYSNLYYDFNNLFKNSIYVDFLENIKEEIKSDKYTEILADINKIKKSDDDFNSQLSKCKDKKELKIFLENVAYGNYNRTVNEILDLIFSSKYSTLTNEFIDLFVNGKYSNVLYDFAYNFLDITYKYETDIQNRINTQKETEETTEIIETTEIVEVETEEIKQTNNIISNISSYIPFLGKLLIYLIIIGLVIIGVKFLISFFSKRNKRIEEENQNEREKADVGLKDNANTQNTNESKEDTNIDDNNDNEEI